MAQDNIKQIIKQEYIKCAKDPVYFMKKYCWIQHPTRGRIQFNLYPFQEGVLNLLNKMIRGFTLLFFYIISASVQAAPTDEQLEAALYTWDWDNVRKERNELLVATDFYALSDVTMSAEMATYRQDLRDIPASTADSKDVVWPTKP